VGKEHNKEGRLQRVDTVVSRIVRCVSYGSAGCLVGIMVVAFINVVLEKAFRIGIPQSTEIIQYLHVPVVFLAVAWVTFDRGHVSIDLLSSHFPKRMGDALSYFTNSLSMLICGFVAYRGVVMTEKFIVNHKMSSVGLISFPLWPFGVLFFVGGFLLAFSFLWCIVRKAAGIKSVPFKGWGAAEDDNPGGPEASANGL